MADPAAAPLAKQNPQANIARLRFNFAHHLQDIKQFLDQVIPALNPAIAYASPTTPYRSQLLITTQFNGVHNPGSYTFFPHYLARTATISEADHPLFIGDIGAMLDEIHTYIAIQKVAQATLNTKGLDPRTAILAVQQFSGAKFLNRVRIPETGSLETWLTVDADCSRHQSELHNLALELQKTVAALLNAGVDATPQEKTPETTPEEAAPTAQAVVPPGVGRGSAIKLGSEEAEAATTPETASTQQPETFSSTEPKATAYSFSAETNRVASVVLFQYFAVNSIQEVPPEIRQLFLERAQDAYTQLTPDEQRALTKLGSTDRMKALFKLVRIVENSTQDPLFRATLSQKLDSAIASNTISKEEVRWKRLSLELPETELIATRDVAPHAKSEFQQEVLADQGLANLLGKANLNSGEALQIFELGVDSLILADIPIETLTSLTPQTFSVLFNFGRAPTPDELKLLLPKLEIYWLSRLLEIQAATGLKEFGLNPQTLTPEQLKAFSSAEANPTELVRALKLAPVYREKLGEKISAETLAQVTHTPLKTYSRSQLSQLPPEERAVANAQNDTLKHTLASLDKQHRDELREQIRHLYAYQAAANAAAASENQQLSQALTLHSVFSNLIEAEQAGQQVLAEKQAQAAQAATVGETGTSPRAPGSAPTALGGGQLLGTLSAAMGKGGVGGIEGLAAASPQLRIALFAKQFLSDPQNRKNTAALVGAVTFGGGLAGAALVNFLAQNPLVGLGTGLGVLAAPFFGPVAIPAGGFLGLTAQKGLNSIKGFINGANNKLSSILGGGEDKAVRGSFGKSTAAAVKAAPGGTAFGKLMAHPLAPPATALTVLTTSALMVHQTMNAALLTPLPTFDESGNVSDDIIIEKLPNPSGENVTPGTITYTINIKTKSGKKAIVQSSPAPQDTMTISYNTGGSEGGTALGQQAQTSSKPSGPTAVPASASYDAFKQQLASLVGRTIDESGVSFSYEIPFTPDYKDATVVNTVSFSYRLEGETADAALHSASGNGMVCFGKCASGSFGCFEFGPAGFNFGKYGYGGSNSLSWTAAQQEKVKQAFSRRGGTHGRYVSALCAQGKITIYHLSASSLGAWGWAPDGTGNLLVLYDNALAANVTTLEYTLLHELGHIYDYRNPAMKQRMLAAGLGTPSPSCFSYPLPGLCNVNERFAEGLAMSIIQQYSFTNTGVYNFVSRHPNYYQWYLANIL